MSRSWKGPPPHVCLPFFHLLRGGGDFSVSVADGKVGYLVK